MVKGITVEGVPLEELLEEKEKQERKNEIDLVCKEESVARTRSMKRTMIKERMREKGGVAKRVRRLTDNQIRREYGIMEKPYKTNMENVLWCIIEMGPISANEIAEMIGVRKNDASGMAGRMAKRLPDYITRDETVKPFIYKATQEISTEAAYRKYKARDNEGQPKETKHRGPFKFEPSEEPVVETETLVIDEKISEVEPEIVEKTPEKIARRVTEEVLETLTEPQKLTIEIRFTGSVKLLIGFVGGDR